MRAAQLPKPRPLAVSGNPVKDIQTDLDIQPPAIAGAVADTSTDPLCNILKLLPSCRARPLDQLWQKILEPAFNKDLTYAKALADNAAMSGSKLRSACYQALVTANAQANGDGLKNSDGSAMTMPHRPWSRSSSRGRSCWTTCSRQPL